MSPDFTNAFDQWMMAQHRACLAVEKKRALEEEARAERAEAAAIRKEARDVVREKAHRIRRRNALRWRNEGMTFREIGERLGVTLERARQIVAKAQKVDKSSNERSENIALLSRQYWHTNLQRGNYRNL